MQGGEDLRKLLHLGWEVRGFTHHAEIALASDSKTAGYAILLQKSEQMAIAQTFFDRTTGEQSLMVNVLTGAVQ
jgi:hypothetical protein